MDATQVLQEAKALISSPEKWTKDEYCRDAAGVALQENSVLGEPASWCVTGAVRAIEGQLDKSEALSFLAKTLNPDYTGTFEGDDFTIESIAHHQDAFGFTHADAMALFDGAIKMSNRKEDE